MTLNPDVAQAGEGIFGGKLVTTASVPADRRLAFWREVVCQTIAGVEAKPLTNRRSYDGRIHSRPVHLQDFRRFDLLHVVADPQRVNRTRELIDLQAEEAWLLMLQEHGTCSIHQGDQRSTLAPGDIGFLDTSRPYEVLFRTRSVSLSSKCRPRSSGTSFRCAGTSPAWRLRAATR